MRSNGLIGKHTGWVDRNERDLNEEDGVRSAALAEIAELARKDDVGASRRAARASGRLMIEHDLVFGKASVALVTLRGFRILHALGLEPAEIGRPLEDTRKGGTEHGI